MEYSNGVSGEISDIIFAIIIYLMAAESGITKILTQKVSRRKAKEKLRKEAQ